MEEILLWHFRRSSRCEGGGATCSETLRGAPPHPLRPKCEHCDYYDYNCDDYHYTTATATVAAAAATAMTTTTTATTTELCGTVGVVAPAKFTTGILT